MKNIELTLQRGKPSGPATLGTLTVSNSDKTFTTLEDIWQTPKVPGKTCIRSGRYQIKFRKDLSPLTIRYREKFPWFTWHLELQNVIDFTNVYIHIGNYADNTDGCILVGTNVDLEKEMITDSTSAYTSLYSYLKGHLNAGGKVWITVLDEEYP